MKSKIILSVIAAAAAAVAGNVTSKKIYRNGYNLRGYDKEGYNKEGYDKHGYDKEGYNKEGYNRGGYDKEGYDKEGYDFRGYDKEGYHFRGYDKYGYDRNGYNEKREHIDSVMNRAENCKEKAEHDLMRAKQDFKAEDYEYAVQKIRSCVEYIYNFYDSAFSKHPCNDNLSNKIKRVERNGIISSERVEKLRIFRDYCGDTIHHDQVASVNGAYMVMKTAEEEMEFFKNKIDELKKIQYKIKGRQSQAAEQ